MAYFCNSGDGSSFEEQCDRCRYGEKHCPIACLQLSYNYEALNNKIATEMLDSLVKQNGSCSMFKTFKKDFELNEGEKAQMELSENIDTKGLVYYTNDGGKTYSDIG